MKKALLAAVVGVILVLLAVAARASAGGLLPPHEPTDTQLPVFSACQGSPAQQISSVNCASQVVAAIDRRHAAEQIGPLELPAGFPGESAPQQLLEVVGAERASQGLTVPRARSVVYDAFAQTNADHRDVPPDPLPDGILDGAIWTGAVTTPLEADFLWMYDDGAGGLNVDCVPNQTGCWDHRNALLTTDYQRDPGGVYLGAGFAVDADGTSFTVVLAAPGIAEVESPYEAPGSHPFGFRAGGGDGSAWLAAAMVIALATALAVGRHLARRPPRRMIPIEPLPPPDRPPPSGPIVRPPDDGPGPWA